MLEETPVIARVAIALFTIVTAASFMLFGYVFYRGLEAIYDSGYHWGALFAGVGSAICFLPLAFLLERLEAQARRQ